MSDARIFFAGMGTTVLLLGAGFSGGLMLASTAIDSLPQNKVTAADRLQPARVVLPTTRKLRPHLCSPRRLQSLQRLRSSRHRRKTCRPRRCKPRLRKLNSLNAQNGEGLNTRTVRAVDASLRERRGAMRLVSNSSETNNSKRPVRRSGSRGSWPLISMKITVGRVASLETRHQSLRSLTWEQR